MWSVAWKFGSFLFMMGELFIQKKELCGIRLVLETWTRVVVSLYLILRKQFLILMTGWADWTSPCQQSAFFLTWKNPVLIAVSSWQRNLFLAGFLFVQIWNGKSWVKHRDDVLIVDKLVLSWILLWFTQFSTSACGSVILSASIVATSRLNGVRALSQQNIVLVVASSTTAPTRAASQWWRYFFLWHAVKPLSIIVKLAIVWVSGAPEWIFLSLLDSTLIDIVSIYHHLSHFVVVHLGVASHSCISVGNLLNSGMWVRISFNRWLTHDLTLQSLLWDAAHLRGYLLGGRGWYVFLWGSLGL